MLFEAGGVVGLALLALWIFCVLDVIGTDDSQCRNLPKGLWLMLVIFLPDIGGIAWLIMGRPEHTTFQPGSSAYRRAPAGIDPTAATSPPRIRPIKYVPSDPSGIMFSNSHPNRPP